MRAWIDATDAEAGPVMIAQLRTGSFPAGAQADIKPAKAIGRSASRNR